MCVDVCGICRCVWDIDILYDYYKRNMSLTEDEAFALYENAQAKDDQGDYKGALKDFTVFLSYAQETGNTSWEGSAYSNIGLAHNRLGNYQDALKYHHKHLEIALQLGDKGGEGVQ